MDLFETATAQPKNLLYKDGITNYYGHIMSLGDADLHLISLLNNICWKNDEAIIFGKKILTKRKVAWYADKSFKYTYSKITKHALPWTEELLTLKNSMCSWFKLIKKRLASMKQ